MPFIPVPNITRVEAVGHVEGSSIGATVPFIGVDALYWPQIAGQQFAPTLVSSAAYTDNAGLPALILHAASTDSAVFPAAPRYAQDKRTATISGQVAFSALPASPGASFTWLSTGGAGSSLPAGSVGITIDNLGVVKAKAHAVGGSEVTVGTILPAITLGTVYDWSIELAADGTVTWSFGGQQLASAAGVNNPTDNAVTISIRTVNATYYFGPMAIRYS